MTRGSPEGGQAVRTPMSLRARSWGAGVLCALLFAASLPAHAAEPVPIEIRDDRAVTVRLAQPARRIVSLLPSLTETVCALDACERLIGIDRHSNHPAQVLALPRLGGLDDVDIERIVALRPDLVLAAVSTRMLERLESLGVTVAAIEPRSTADVRHALDRIGRLVGSDASQRVWRQIEGDIARARALLVPAARGLGVYFEVGNGPYAASEASFPGELMVQLGLRNIVPGRLGPYPQINPEFVVTADPALILIAARQADELARRPGWKRISALREKRVCRIAPSEGDVLVRAGPRIGEAALLLAGCVNRELSAAPLGHARAASP
jgi:iron complex transport system substrate-binding protein